MKKQSPKKVVKVTTTREELEEQRDNPVPALIRSYLIDGEEYSDELRELHYIVSVQKYSKDGRAVTVTGRVYEDLEQLPYQLGQRFGTSRFRLFIKALDGEDNTKAIVKILDFPIEWDGDEPTDDLEEENPEPSQFSLQLELQRDQHAHEIRMKEMDNQKETLIAAFNAKGTGTGMRVQDMIQLINLGASMASGHPIDGASEENNPFMETLKTMIPPILSKLMAGQQPGNNGTHPPAAPAGEVEHSRVGI